MNRKTTLMLLVVAGVLSCCALSFHQIGAAQNAAPPAMDNGAQEPQKMISNLEEIKNLLKEQNALLRSGQVKVIVTELPKD